MSLFQSFPNLRELNITSVVDTFVPVGQTWLIKNIIINDDNTATSGSGNIGLDIGGTYHIVASNDPEQTRILTPESSGGNGGDSFGLGNNFGCSYILNEGDHISSDTLKSVVAGTDVDFTVYYYILESDFGVYLEGWPSLRINNFTDSVDNTSISTIETVTVPANETWFITSIVGGFDLDLGTSAQNGVGRIIITKSGGSGKTYMDLRINSNNTAGARPCRWVREALANVLILNTGDTIKWSYSMNSTNAGAIAKTEFKISYYVYELDFPQT